MISKASNMAAAFLVVKIRLSELTMLRKQYPSIQGRKYPVITTGGDKYSQRCRKLERVRG